MYHIFLRAIHLKNYWDRLETSFQIIVTPKIAENINFSKAIGILRAFGKMNKFIGNLSLHVSQNNLPGHVKFWKFFNKTLGVEIFAALKNGNGISHRTYLITPGHATCLHCFDSFRGPYRISPQSWFEILFHSRLPCNG
jgi:hypothetical protein